MTVRNHTVARIISRAWRDDDFRRDLLADPAAALDRLDIALPAGRTLRVVENTPERTYLVLTSPRYTECQSDYADIKAFSECYYDPRLFPLNWGSHDPVFSERIRRDPHALLRRFGVAVDDGHTVEIVENGRTSAFLVLPQPPSDADARAGVPAMMEAGHCPPAVRYFALLGLRSYRDIYGI